MRFGKDTFGKGYIGSFGDELAPVGAHILLQLRRLGEHEQSAGLAVQAVYYVHIVTRVLPAYVGFEYGQGCCLRAVRVGRHGEQALLLVDHQKVVILIYEGEFGVVQRGSAGLREDRYFVAGIEGLVAPCGDCTVHLHAPCTQQLLDARDGHAAELSLHEFEQRGGCCGA